MKEKKSEAPRRGNEELFKWDGNPTFGCRMCYTGNSGCKCSE